MQKNYCAVMGVVLSLISVWVEAKEIVVPSGFETLKNALEQAENGDVLLLQTGGYDGSIQINKSITVRPISISEKPIIKGIVYVQSSGTIMQNLTFLNTTVSCGGSNIEILENRFTNSSLSCRSGGMVVIGNVFESDHPSHYSPIYLGYDSYVAGNSVNASSDAGTGISVSSDSWVVGNSISMDGKSHITAINGLHRANIRVIGNRINIRHQANFDTGTVNLKGIVTGSNSLVANNIITAEIKPDGSVNAETIFNPISTSGPVKIINNIYYRSDTDGADKNPVIQAGDSVGIITGNIIIGHQYNELISAPNATIKNNICFGNEVNCGTENGNLDIAPAFIDTLDFKLADNSPAIDAGSEDFQYTDLDLSRNDIGAYGGSWAIEQFDIQRTPGRTEPYVYPLWEALDDQDKGTLNIRALGIARFR